MQEVKTIGPNWKMYWAVLIAFSCIAVALILFLSVSYTTFLFLATIPAFVLVYLLYTQNILEIHSLFIIHKFLFAFREPIQIDIKDIEWVALDKQKKQVRAATFFLSSSAIIKLKNGEVIKIPLNRLDNYDVAERYFHDLSDQMVDHDTDLVKLKDIHGVTQLAKDATLGLTDLVEAMHQNFTKLPGMSDVPLNNAMAGLTGAIYQSIRNVTGLTGGRIDALLAQLTPILGKHQTSNKLTPLSPERAAVLSALNGVLGDYMAETKNPMTISMRFRRNGRSLALNSKTLLEELSPINGKIVVLVHGLCMNDLQWCRQDHDHGVSLAKDLGYTPVYLRYNSGLHISNNGRSFAELLDVLVKVWPVEVEELVLLGHSMGGLVSRSAVHYAEKKELPWIKKVQKMIFLGSPHHGAPLERGGNWVDIILDGTPFTAPLSRIGKIRSSGITDLRYGNVIDEHWHGRDRFERSKDNRQPVPLPKDVKCFALAGTTGKKVGDVRDLLLGDGLVQVKSALGKHEDPRLQLLFPEERQWLGYGVNHMDLLNDLNVYEKIKLWLS